MLRDGLYVIEKIGFREQVNVAKESASGVDFWHIRFGHGNKAMLNEMSRNHTMKGLNMKAKALHEVDCTY